SCSSRRRDARRASPSLEPHSSDRGAQRTALFASLLLGDRQGVTEAPVPETRNLPKLRAAAAGCKACDLWKTGTQTVFGEGSKNAEIVFVGEQPGDKEDVAGKPFVGPAGRVFDEGLAVAGIGRRAAFVTNAVKHFKWEARGKRRIHQKPNAAELTACRPWLDAELEAVRPNVLVVMGATAAQALLGRQFRVTKDRGRPVDSDLARFVLATVHPSSILRQRTDEERAAAMADFVADLKIVAKLMGQA